MDLGTSEKYKFDPASPCIWRGGSIKDWQKEKKDEYKRRPLFDASKIKSKINTGLRTEPIESNNLNEEQSGY